MAARKARKADSEISEKRRALSNPLGLKLWEQLRMPRLWTVPQLAEALGANSHRIRCHLRILEDAGLVQGIDPPESELMPDGNYRGLADGPSNWGTSSDPVERAQFFNAW